MTNRAQNIKKVRRIASEVRRIRNFDDAKIVGRKVVQHSHSFASKLPGGAIATDLDRGHAEMIVRAHELEEFVATSDSLGGPNAPGCVDYWKGFRYVPTYSVNQSLDPYGDAYFAEQLALYEEISGRKLDQLANELLDFDVKLHIDAPNPYNHPDPSILAGQVATLASACQAAGASRGNKVLDMGCGWGLSSETLAYCGLDVDAVDINQGFVDLVNGRAERLGLPIQAYKSNFDTFEPARGTQYSFSLFYECFHHATKPWELMERVVSMLEPTGKFILAAEPVQSNWWIHWGLRLDPLSVYCIHKYGWFESGWSEEFLCDMFARNGLTHSSIPVGNDPTAVHVGTQIEPVAQANLQAIARPGEWWDETAGCLDSKGDSGYLVSKGDSTIDLNVPPNTARIHIMLNNFRQTPIDVTIHFSSLRFNVCVSPGAKIVRLPWSLSSGSAIVRFVSPCWVPSEETGSADTRSLSIHLSSVRYATR